MKNFNIEHTYIFIEFMMKNINNVNIFVDTFEKLILENSE